MEGTEQDVEMLEGSDDLMSTSASSTNGGDTNGCGRKSSITSPDPTSYVAKARVTRPTPPPPSKNPMQFVQIKPCNLYQTAQQQLKKAEEVKKLKEVKKEEPEEWQNNLDNWKSSRRKRVEHIIDRVVETKKLELEEHDRMRRKSKTFTEMMEERAERGGSRGRVKLASLAVYNEDEANDLSDLGIGTSSASGKSSQSEDYDNNSVMSDNAAELDKAIGAAGSATATAGKASSCVEEQQNHINRNGNANNEAGTSNAAKMAIREYISSPGYDTSSSTAPASSPDPCEYTYEGAIQDYKQRVQRASSNGNTKISSSPSSNVEPIAYPTRRGSKIEDRLSGFEVTSPSDTQEGVEKQPKVDVPKVDISKRKEIFEQAKGQANGTPAAAAQVPKLVLRERLTNGNGSGTTTVEPVAKQEMKRLSGDISSIRDRMQSLEQQRNAFNTSKSVDVPVPPLKHRLNSLQHAVTKEEPQKKPPLVALVDARQLEIMRGEEERMRQRQQQKLTSPPPPPPALIVEEPHNDDSGIQEDNQEEQLNAAIAALALEERQLEEAANAVNQIEAEFDELTDLNPSPLPNQASSPVPLATNAAAATPAPVPTAAPAPPLRDMEFSVSSTNNFHESPCDVDVVAVASKLVSVSPTQQTPLPNPNSYCNLRRKPSNEMIHHRNLLKMFKDTFQNDEELKEVNEPNTTSTVFDFTKSTPTQIPRPLGKPPMSPKAVRVNLPVKPPTSPPMSPKAVRISPPVKPSTSPPSSQQFSINGRVEIFNSRQLDKPRTPPAPPKRILRVEPPLNDPRTPPEVVLCAPPVTIVSPEELPKANTVKQLSHCFNHTEAAAPKPLPRSRIPQITPPASPKPFRKDLPLSLDVVDRSSEDYAPVMGQTKAIVHTPPTASKARSFTDPLAPNDSLQMHPVSPSEMPALKLCPPNESSLFKLASSRPTSPTQVDIALCQQFLQQEAPTNLELSEEDRHYLDEMAIQELPCDKIDVAKSPLPSTSCQLISQEQLNRCDGQTKEASLEPLKAEDIALCAGLLDCLAPAQEPLCDSIDIKKSPVPATGYQDISEAEVKRCDGGRIIAPIGDARAAHSKALMDTCEQIIAEERLASSQMMKSSLPDCAPSTTTPTTPLPHRKSKIPIPKSCCISASGTDSLSRGGYAPAVSAEQPLIARTHLVETEIKVTSPNPAPLSPPVTKEKKTKNIFDFLKRNFGHHEDKETIPEPHPTLNETLEPKVILTSTRSGVDVVVNADEVVKVDNSKFYIASEEPLPPPLPKTPAPVKIEIRKTITTDEILEENSTEKALTQEISDLLDDEINKLQQ